MAATRNTKVLKKAKRADNFPFDTAVNMDETKRLNPPNRNPAEKIRIPSYASAYTVSSLSANSRIIG